MKLEERFWRHVDVKHFDECWEWDGALFSNGYGSIRIGSRRGLTHRIAYELKFGPIPNGLYVLHSCDNPKCCNPNHLFLGTQLDNMHDMHKKKRWKCSNRGGELNSNCKLSDVEVEEIKKLYVSGSYSYRDLSKIYHVTYGHIGKIITNKFR